MLLVFLNDGEFKPFTPSRNVEELFQDLADNLGIANPYDIAEETIDKIKDILELVPLEGEFPNIPNPLTKSVLPALPQLNTTGLPPLPNPAANTGTQFGSISPVSGLTISEEMFFRSFRKKIYCKQTKTKQPN